MAQEGLDRILSDASIAIIFIEGHASEAMGNIHPWPFLLRNSKFQAPIIK
jgi:hypothetical protein